MVSEKAARILRKHGFQDEAIGAMNETEAWREVYARAPTRRTRASPITICFTGFVDIEKSRYQRLAESLGLRVTSGVSGKTSYLFFGANAGPAKLAKAQELGVKIMEIDRFLNLVETGELP